MSGFVYAVTPNEIREVIIAMKTLTDVKRLAIIGAVLLGFLAGGTWDARADALDQDTVIVAQHETQTATDEKKEPSTESKEPETKTDQVQESTGAEKKPLKEFKPSEQIEAEQAVDFPYDI
jgi:hypothetical protein